MSNIPLISVCIATYNQAHYLEACIESVIQQTLPADEIIISNDASTDNTYDVLEKISGKYNFIRIIHQPVNLGLTGNSDAVLKAANGNYLVRLASDDLLLPSFTIKLSKLLTNYPEAGFAHCAVKEINVTGKHIKDRYLFREKIFENADEALKEVLKGFKVAANILMFKKTALEKIGYLNCKQNFGEDYYLSAELSANGYGNVYCNEILACYRTWNDTQMARQKRKLEEIKGLTSVFTKVISPAYKAKGRNMHNVDISREKFAVAQADCLSWKVYNKAEKEELLTALKYLSSSKKSLFYYKIYLGKFSVLPVTIEKLRSRLKGLAKQLTQLKRKIR